MEIELDCRHCLTFCLGRQTETVDAALVLIDSICPSKKGQSHREPVFIIVFDEAQTLIQDHDSWSSWFTFSELRDTLRSMSSGQVSVAIFTLFLSKRAHPQQSVLMKGENHIESVSPRSIDPYTDLGFDQFAKMINWGDTWTLEKVATDAHLATLGRPMYVIN